jgi:pseudouridine-5'-phosphate glycosidase/pseudouridine kinase
MLKLLSTRSFRVSGNCSATCSIAHRKFRTIAPDNAFFKISEEVREALNQRKPIVALETTIYTHGFPHPDNVALASELESIVRVNGGVPATIGILDGVARVGLSSDELARLASSAGSKSTLKLSRRELSFACGLQRFGKLYNGGTTIAATMILAHKAGIKVFATGGLGGVHRGGESTMDISADLTELGRTPVAVVSSGCKSFLDIPRTLEYLETQGVGVATFTDGNDPNSVEFPAFWARGSGVKSPMVVESESEAAAIICELIQSVYRWNANHEG